MGLKELLEEYVSELAPEVKQVLLETIAIENELQDVADPKQAKSRIKDVIERRAKTYRPQR